MRYIVMGGICFFCCGMVSAQEKAPDLADLLRKTDFRTYESQEKTRAMADQVWVALQARREAANERSTRAWNAIQTREQWETFRDQAIQALKRSLGQFPPAPAKLKIQVTKKLAGEGFIVENLVYESRPGLVVTANLYGPARPTSSMPGIIIVHSHHNPKTQGELQDMGMTWARSGCLVLVPDMLGHGERRQHPFTDAGKYAGSFKPGRQDYYFRYNSGMQLHLIGDSLMGWMAWDLMRGVDLLLDRPGIDPKRIILLGSVAGGGDPAAVTAAIDPRITAVAPFNFGGPQPETKFPLPPDAEKTFDYLGGGSWESTRNLSLSGHDGFLPWVIVGSVAPRRLMHAHEFSWDGERDPVWKRYQKIFGFYGATDHLGVVHGRGTLRGKPPEATHCNNIGPEHRKQIYLNLKKWFNIPVPEQEYQKRFPADELQCLRPEIVKAWKPNSLHEVAGEWGAYRVDVTSNMLKYMRPKQRRVLHEHWSYLLGMNQEKAAVTLRSHKATTDLGKCKAEIRDIRHQVGSFPPEEFPFLLLIPEYREGNKLPVVVAMAHEGRQGFLKNRAETIAGLLQRGVAVCLPDLRGTGELAAGLGKGRTSSRTSLSASELMLGRTLLGTRLEELGMLLDVLRSGKIVKTTGIALWGDSFVPVNDPNQNLAVPLDADRLPNFSEPGGGLLALLGGLFHEDVRAVYIRGGLVNYQSLLASPYLYVPHDAIVAGALPAGDLGELAATLAPRPLRLEALVDGLNCLVSAKQLEHAYRTARVSFGPTSKNLILAERPATELDLATWLTGAMKP